MAADLFASKTHEPSQSDGVAEASVFIEQAEYLTPESFLAFTIDHPSEQEIIRKLGSGGAKLLVGPRGCGKTTLMLKAYHALLNNEQSKVLPVYVNFKLSLKLEPLYQSTPNAAFWFRTWLILKIYDALYGSLDAFGIHSPATSLPTKDEISRAILTIESGDPNSFNESLEYHVDELVSIIEDILYEHDVTRCVLLLDDAAHAFSPKQQEDFFDFFRRVKSQRIAPKAAIYPGITILSPSFHVGHDAEQIDVWIRPDSDEYVNFMRGIAGRRLGNDLPAALTADPEILPFLAYCAFGIPRSFLNMLRYLQSGLEDGVVSVDRRRVLDAAKQSRADAHAIFDSLSYKLPVFKKFIENGDDLYTIFVSVLKQFNKERNLTSQGVEVALKRPLSSELSKILGFFQYAGLIMPSGENSRGIKGVFDIFFLHFADLVTENAIVGQRAKSLGQFVQVFKSAKHQIWPRINSAKLMQSFAETGFALALPPCQVCGAERANEDAKFCANCGSELKTASLYHALIAQDISVLPITKSRAAKIKKHSQLRTIKDVLLDGTRQELRGVPQVGPRWAERIARYAEEHVA